jgi:hypothetical protein
MRNPLLALALIVGLLLPIGAIQVRSGDFLADAKIPWRDAYEMQMRAAVRPAATGGGVRSRRFSIAEEPPGGGGSKDAPAAALWFR